MIKYELLNAAQATIFSLQRAGQILGLNPERLYRWKNLYNELGLFSLADKPPEAKCLPHRLLPEEKEDILNYADKYPEQRHRELQFNLERDDIAYLSPSSVYRILKEKKLIKEHKVLKPKRLYTKPKATFPHQHWLLDLTYILNGPQMRAKSLKKFLRDIGVLNEYSRPHTPERPGGNRALIPYYQTGGGLPSRVYESPRCPG